MLKNKQIPAHNSIPNGTSLTKIEKQILLANFREQSQHSHWIVFGICDTFYSQLLVEKLVSLIFLETHRCAR